jgi:carbamoyltransferase
MARGLILSLYYGNHDSNVTVATRSRVLLHLLSERFYRRKNQTVGRRGMERLVAGALEYLGADIADCDEVLLASWASPHPPDQPTIRLLGRELPVTLTGHHRNHAFSGPTRPAHGSLVLCFDGGSEDGLSSLYEVDGDNLIKLESLDDTMLTGAFYGTATQLILQPDYYKAHVGETGKLLGLSGYGSDQSDIERLVWENLDQMNALHRTLPVDLLARLGLDTDYATAWRNPRRLDVAHTVQRMWERELIRRLRPYAGPRPIALVGGCAQNVVANSVLVASRLFNRVTVPPAPGDGGQALGALFAAYPNLTTESPYLGRSFATVAPEAAPALAEQVAADLLAGRVVGLFQNASEIGPRALGNRSILALASDPDNRERVSIEVKRREPYRPLGPMALTEHIGDLVESPADHRYLGFAPQATDLGRKAMAAAVHVDGTTRIQSVTESQHPTVYNVLRKLRDAGEMAVINTSLNVAGRPIADTPADARECFESTALDVLYLGRQRLAKAGAGRL